MDVALRVVESVTMMHNGRIFKEGTPGGDRDRSRGAGALSRRTAPWLSARPAAPRAPILEVRGLNVYYGASPCAAGRRPHARPRRALGRRPQRHGQDHALQGDHRPVRGARAAPSASTASEIAGSTPHEIARLGIGYVPQGRRLWRSLTVDEHLRHGAARPRRGAWTVERIYDDLPAARRAQRQRRRPALRRRAADARDRRARCSPTRASSSWTSRPRASRRSSSTRSRRCWSRLAEEGDIAVLVIEQNIGVATAVAEHVAIMVNGRINRIIDVARRSPPTASCSSACSASAGTARGHEAEPAAGDAQAAARRRGRSASRARAGARLRLEPGASPTRWSQPVPAARIEAAAAHAARAGGSSRAEPTSPRESSRAARRAAARTVVLVAGTLDTKGRGAALHPRPAPRRWASGPALVDLSTSRQAVAAPTCPPHEVARAPSARRDRASSPATAARRSRPWRRPSSAGSRASAASPASSRPAARAAPRWRPPACARCRSACPKSWSRPSPPATSAAMSAPPTS